MAQKLTKEMLDEMISEVTTELKQNHKSQESIDSPINEVTISRAELKTLITDLVRHTIRKVMETQRSPSPPTTGTPTPSRMCT